MRLTAPKFLRLGMQSAAHSGRELAAVLDSGVRFEGRISAPAGTVRINAQFKGEIDSSGSVIVAESGEVEGNIHAREISVAGKVKGAIDAAERVLIKPQGVVIGEIYSPSLTVEPGGYFDGQCHPTSHAETRSQETEVRNQNNPAD